MKIYAWPLALLLVVAAVDSRADQKDEEVAQKYALKLIAALDTAKPADRVTAAEQLGLVDGPDVLVALRQHAATEKEPHCRFALLYAMGFHGDVAAIRQIGDHARDEVCLRYLQSLTGRNERDADKWRSWLADMRDGELAKLAASRRTELQWEEYSHCFVSQYFHSLEGENDPDQLKTEFLCGLPHAHAWGLFASATYTLAKDGDRAKAASLLAELTDKYPSSHHAKEALELRDLLRGMVEEDKRWKEPKDVNALRPSEKIQYYIYHLRDVHEEQWSQPGDVEVLGAHYRLIKAMQEFTRKSRTQEVAKKTKDAPESPASKSSSNAEDTKNAARHLLEIGEPGVPSLLAILDDRRPLRSVGYWRDFWPERTVLRYQDAAIQILNELLPASFYDDPYLSKASPERRASIVTSVRNWYKESAGKPRLQQKWNAVKYVGIHSVIPLLKSLALDDGQRTEVVAELHRRYDNNHWVYRPRYAELLAELGDTSKVAEVLDDYRRGKFDKQLIYRTDDSAASLNSRDAAERLMEKYGKQGKTEKDAKH